MQLLHSILGPNGLYLLLGHRCRGLKVVGRRIHCEENRRTLHGWQLGRRWLVYDSICTMGRAEQAAAISNGLKIMRKVVELCLQSSEDERKREIR